MTNGKIVIELPRTWPQQEDLFIRIFVLFNLVGVTSNMHQPDLFIHTFECAFLNKDYMRVNLKAETG